MIRPKNKTEDLLLSITENCQTLIKQIHTGPEETMEFEMTKPIERILFDPPNQNKDYWMLGLVSCEVYISIFNITEENHKFKLYKFPVGKCGGVSYEKVRDKIKKDLDISDITATDLQNDIIAPNIFED